MRWHRPIWLAGLFALAASLSASGDIAVGSTKEEVIDRLGTPEAEIKRLSRETLFYGNHQITLAHGRVVEMEPDAEWWILAAKEESASPSSDPFTVATSQGAQPEAALEPPSAQAHREEPAVRVIKRNGARIDLKEIVVPGKVTIVDFYADWCAPCRRISPHLEQMAETNEDVYLRKVDMVKWGTPVAQQYGLRSIPNIRVFDRRGSMVGQPTPSLQLVQQYVGQAK